MYTTQPININSADFLRKEYTYYRWLRDHAPVSKARMGRLMQMYVLARYDDVLHMLKDPRFVRNRTTATGKPRRTPIPLPKAFAAMTQSMILADEPDHRRLRTLVHQAFTPRTVARLAGRIESLANELLDRAEQQESVDLLMAYAQPIPVTVIAELLGVPEVDRAAFRQWTGVFTRSLSLRNMVGLYLDMRAIEAFIRNLIAKRRAAPGDDLLTALIQAEDAGQQLSEDELVSMTILLLIAGYETTINLIGNGTYELLSHPDQLARLRQQPDLIGSAVEEILRFNSPVASTKPCYTVEAVTLGDVTIPKGAMVMPLLASANRDERVFENPDTFDIARTPNKHLGFGHGIHFCLGAPLARLEGQIALGTLVARYPNLRLAVPSSAIRYVERPLMHRLQRLPVTLK
ncbi:MAG TPA: cytochrome P450 [Herpetosiphonaceae bacterium]